MAKLKPAQIAEVKGKGFLINRGTENFSGRIVPRGTVFSPDDLKTVSEISSKFGNGKVIPTTRLGLEIQGISYENKTRLIMPKVTDLNAAEREIKSVRLHHVKVQLVFTAIMTLTHLPQNFMMNIT